MRLSPAVRPATVGLSCGYPPSPVYGEVECPFPFALTDLSHIREIIKRFTRRTTGTSLSGRSTPLWPWSS
jgi:hypothetical protein